MLTNRHSVLDCVDVNMQFFGLLSTTYFQTKLNRINELVPRADPIQSIFPCRSTGGSRGLKAQRGVNVITPRQALRDRDISSYFSPTSPKRITYMKMKNHFHSVRCRKAPKNKAPRYPPIGADAPKKPRLRFRTRPGGLVLDIIATALGMINAPPRPARARIVTKAKKLLQKALARVQMVSQAPPAKTSSRWP